MCGYSGQVLNSEGVGVEQTKGLELLKDLRDRCWKYFEEIVGGGGGRCTVARGFIWDGKGTVTY